MIRYQVNIKNIACGFGHTLFQTEFGNVYSMGSNEYGQLGIDLKEKKRFKATKISITEGREKIWKIAAGARFSVLYSENNYLYLFGENTYNQLCIHDDNLIEIKDFKNKKYNKIHINALFKGDTVNLKGLKAGENHVGVINENNSIALWGDNRNNQIGLSTNKEHGINILKNNSDIDKLELGYNISLYLSKEGDIYVMGNIMNNLYNKFTKLQSENKFMEVKATSYICALTTECNLCFIGDTPFGVKKEFSYLYDYDVIDYSIGDKFLVFMNNYDEIYTMGSNNKGQLGIGDTRIAQKDTPNIIELLTDQIGKLYSGKDFSVALGKNIDTNATNLKNLNRITMLKSNMNDNISQKKQFLTAEKKVKEEGSNSASDLLTLFNNYKNNYYSAFEYLLSISSNNTKNKINNILFDLKETEDLIINYLSVISSLKLEKNKRKKIPINLLNNIKLLRKEYEQNITPNNYKEIYLEYLKGNMFIKTETDFTSQLKKLKNNNKEIDDIISEINDILKYSN